MMMNPSGSNEERTHQIPSSSNLVMKNQSGIVILWTPQELAILDNAIIKYGSEPSVLLRYAKIASELEAKTIRDVAMRCKWMHKKETSNKRRKEDHNGSGRVIFDNKEIIDMVVASNLPPYQLTLSSILSQEHGITNELVEENNKLFNQINENFTSCKLIENLTSFSKIGENIRKLLNDINENVPETMNHMPKLPEDLKDGLLDAIFVSSNLP